jgi:hypothetical protein
MYSERVQPERAARDSISEMKSVARLTLTLAVPRGRRLVAMVVSLVGCSY